MTKLQIQKFPKDIKPCLPAGRYRPKASGGFTLIELLIYVSVLALVITLSILFTLGVIEAAIKSSAKEEVQVNIANIIQSFDFEVRQAESLYVSTSDFVGDPGQLSFVSSRNLPVNEIETYVDMYLDKGRFCLKREVSGVSCITSSGVEVTSLTFKRIVQSGGAESVQMRFSIQNRISKSEYQFQETIQTSARLRSY